MCVQSPLQCQINNDVGISCSSLSFFLSVVYELLTSAAAGSHAEASCSVLPGTLKRQS